MGSQAGPWYEAATALPIQSAAGNETALTDEQVELLRQRAEATMEAEAAAFTRDLGVQPASFSCVLQHFFCGGTMRNVECMMG